jgi:hypothetical protein
MNSSHRSVLFLSQAGCLLPFFIIFNLCFGWLFLKFTHWLILEAVLVLLFMLNSFIFTRKIISRAQGRDGAIDVKAEVVEDKPQS